MSIETLKKLRFLVPGIIIFLFWAMLGSFTGDWKVQTSLAPDEVGKTASAFVLGLLYYVLPLRDWANRRNHDAVNSNISQALIKIGSDGRNPDKSSWQQIKPLFYRLVNADDSLTNQSKRAMFNGLLWTSSADARAISIIFMIISVAYHFAFDSQGALMGVFVFAAIAVFTWPISWTLTEMHKRIGDEQIEIIRSFHSSEVEEFFRNE
ncbi:hypothetical protein [Pseudosulfitobacter pseudonitzschiae]|uniref:hypothetical protein n=1 Tax=Pseudosulfitobacter pseudonitzschiae TaxID=1402135 RepID=UPI001AF12066|nr:hypothetical protein [Pseudosulfitobacter pseudonitzschiae]MBM1818045.1 hypothetical protein [Pseudosulfitobacter pseudonitzschiae]MBM1835072.1 hypothetical protein [Pseudosulfitobacter pseudonitzschiae]MBM1839904.1 hypothetical protein [Pseudosulfitobacter pseudonitzschiae]MBM1844787.1 hypothetical protein [Pseudosulfitobacter pseudonitzschiae]MBM1849590.1 hypothetical protein [Pseudosulfitobacter pseudonitzschiae]